MYRHIQARHLSVTYLDNLLKQLTKQTGHQGKTNMFLRNIFEALARTGEGKAAVVGWGRGMGHKGHMYLASSVITHADQLGADPYFVVSRTVGKDDPITPEEKLAIYKKVFPEQGHIFQTATDEIPDLTRVLSDLNRQGYTSATIVLGADQVKAFQYLKNYNGKPDKAGNVPYKFDTLDVISRQETSDPSAGEEGPRATPMRAVLMDPTKSEEEQFQVWRDAMNPQISDDEVRDLMAKAKERMTAMSAPKPKKAKAVAEGDYTTEKQILTRIRQIMYDRKLSGTESNTGELNRLKQQLKDIRSQQGVAEEWSQKYKSSINCSHPKGFSQKAHCAGKKKHNEDVEMEAVCPDCGMCEAHGNNKIYDKCWTGFRKVPGKKRGEDDSCKKIGEVDDPWGPQGRFAGDTHVDVGGSFTRSKLQVGDLVQVNAGNIKGVGEIWEIKGDQAEVWIDSYARSFNIDLTDLTPYVRGGNVEQTLEEGTSIESTLRAVINDIGEPITSVYDAMKFQAKKYVDNHGELDRGFRMVAAGIGGRWVQNMYVGRLQNELYDLCRYNTRRTVELQEFLRGVEIDGELEMKRSFGSIANNLPRILSKLGQHLDAPQLTKNANRWMQNKAAYEEYIANLEADDDYEEPASVKAPKSNVIGQQNVQVDQIVNSVLSKLPKRIQGDIRNAIARAPNKLQALQAELQKRGQQGMAEAKRKKKSSRSLRGYFFPGYSYYGGDESGEGGGGEGAAEGSEKTECPPATQDIALNLKNRQKAIDEYGYGPLNPDMPNNTFWMKKVDEWNLDSVDEAKQSLCGNCAAFDQREDTLNCIAQGIDSDNPTDAEGTIDAGDLGYCKFLKFKCASRRTCDAWVTGGPLVNEVTFKKSPYGKTAASQQRARELLNPPKPPEPKKDEKDTTEHIVKVKGGYELRSKHGNKNLGKYPTRAGAEKRERQVQYFKHAGEEIETEEKIKGVDGKACWPGKRYAGRVQKADGTYKDKCIPVSEDIQNVMDALINKIVVNEAIQNNKR